MLNISLRSSQTVRNATLINLFSRSNSTSLIVNEIVIPKKIPRGKTDILKALSSTIQTDETAAAYKYADDPYLLPRNLQDKRTFALSKESGKRAAKYFLDNYPHLFYRDEAEPKIEKFSYKDTYNENLTFEVSDLVESIKKREVQNAIIAYEKLKKDEIDIPVDVKISLFDLLCFFNCKNIYDYDFTEELWFRNDKSTLKTWNENELAEKIYAELAENANLSVNSAYIQGLLKYGSTSKAYLTYTVFKEQNKKVNLQALNSLIGHIPFIKETGESRIELMISLLNEIHTNGYEPNIKTFNNCLFTISKSRFLKDAINYSYKILGEMKKLNIEPDLLTYYHILNINYNIKVKNKSVIYEIINYLSNKEITQNNVDDGLFFEKAMQVCDTVLHDVSLAMNIHQIYLKNDHSRMINSNFIESKYYQHFFKVLCKGSTSENLMDQYIKYVPNIYIPDFSVMLEIIYNINLNESFEFIPQIWLDIKEFRLINHDKIITNISKIISREDIKNVEFREQFGLIANEIMKKYKQLTSNDRSVIYNNFENIAIIYNNCIKALFLNNQIDDLINVIRTFDNDQIILNAQSDMENEDLILKVTEKIIEKNNYEKIVFMTNYSTKKGFDKVTLMIKNKINSSSLDENQRNYILNLIE